MTEQNLPTEQAISSSGVLPEVKMGKTIFHYEKAYITFEKCIRCNGTGSANWMTYPDQCGRNGCRLCNGTGKQRLQNIPVSYEKQN